LAIGHQGGENPGEEIETAVLSFWVIQRGKKENHNEKNKQFVDALGEKWAKVLPTEKPAFGGEKRQQVSDVCGSKLPPTKEKG